MQQHETAHRRGTESDREERTPRAAARRPFSPEDEDREAEDLVRRLRPRPPRWQPPAA
jgi:hypothetical protein